MIQTNLANYLKLSHRTKPVPDSQGQDESVSAVRCGAVTHRGRVITIEGEVIEQATHDLNTPCEILEIVPSMQAADAADVADAGSNGYGGWGGVSELNKQGMIQTNLVIHLK